MNFFPAFINLYEKNVVICGDNEEAFVKGRKMKDFGATVHIFSENLSECEGFFIHKKNFLKEDFSLNPVLVITSLSEEENRRILTLCREYNVLCNAVDQPEACDFFFPSYFNTENFCVAVSTSGKSPTASIKLKNDFKDMVPRNIDEILDWAVLIREELKARFPDNAVFKKKLKSIVEMAICEQRILKKDEIDKICEK